MPGTSPLLHAPSLAQHGFVALMGGWYLCSLAWSLYVWWGTGTHDPFIAVISAGLLTITQVSAQMPLLRKVMRGNVPGWFRYCAASTAVALFAGALNLAAFVAMGPEPRNSLLEWFHSWVAPEAICLLGWYRGWWHVLRRGWTAVSTSLIAAGIHGVVLIGIVDLGFTWGARWVLLWFVPVNFFVGWSLLFLPGAVAAHECVPVFQGRVRPLWHIVAWILPAIYAVVPLMLIALMLDLLHG